MRAWGLTDKGVVRKENQDAYFLELYRDRDQALCIVCDGMGGAKAGDVASSMAVELTSEYLSHSLKPGMSPRELASVLKKAVEQANKEVFRYAVSNADCFGMGTTLVAAIVEGNTAVLANVGDSRAYRITREGAVRLTRDHSVVEEMISRGEISRDQARTHPVKNYITRAVGTEDKVLCDVYTEELAPGDFLLLCTDGLSNIVSDPELLFEVLYCGEPDDCCTRLMKIAAERGAPDNVTIVLLQR